jgi:hypothetical protein
MLLPASFHELCLLPSLALSTPQHRVRVSPFSHGGSEQSYQGKKTRFEDLRKGASCDEDSSCEQQHLHSSDRGLDQSRTEMARSNFFFPPSRRVFRFGVSNLPVVPTGTCSSWYLPNRYNWYNWTSPRTVLIARVFQNGGVLGGRSLRGSSRSLRGLLKRQENPIASRVSKSSSHQDHFNASFDRSTVPCAVG